MSSSPRPSPEPVKACQITLLLPQGISNTQFIVPLLNNPARKAGFTGEELRHDIDMEVDDASRTLVLRCVGSVHAKAQALARILISESGYTANGDAVSATDDLPMATLAE